MDADIKNTQDALKWLERRIHEEAEADGEMANEHAIQLGFIQNMLAKFPRRNCDRYATVDEAMDDFADKALIEEWNALKAGKDRDMLAVELFVFTKWLYAPATEQEGESDGSK
jgi:hypothetical protein